MTNPVKLLSDDEVAEIEARVKDVYAKWHSAGYVKSILDADIPALCATVRALREQLDKLNALGEEMLTRLEKVAGIGTKADHGWYFVVGEIERQNTALREQLAEARTWIDRKNAAIETWQQEAKELKSQLAQVTQERDRYADALESATKGIKCDD